MKSRVFFPLIFALSILCGFVTCRTHPIVQEEKPSQETVLHEKTSQEKVTPQGTPQRETAPQNGFLERMLQKISPQDTFTRIYAIDFSSFHNRANAALQDHAETHKGNSFKISRLEGNAVVLRGVYLRDGGREKYVSILTIKSIDSQKCQLEIKFNTQAVEFPSPNFEEAAKEIFQIIEEAIQKPQ